MELRHLRYFVAVAEERHFGRAARRLRIAQPPLSRQIQALEAELGFALLDRSRRRVELTPAGMVLFRHTQHVFGALELAVREARRAAAGETGRLALGYSSSVALIGFTELLRAFRTRAPGVDIALRELSPQAQIDGILAGDLDVGFIRGPLQEPGLASRRVWSEPIVLALPSDHPLAAKKRIPLALAASEPFVSFPRARGPAYFDQLMRLCHEAGFTPRIVQEAPQLDMVSLVAAGFGIALLPASMRWARRPGVVFRSLASEARAELFVAWRPDNSSPSLRRFLELVDQHGFARRGGGRRT